jgi:hypothetical protein
MNLTDTYRIFHPTVVEYLFFFIAHGAFSKIVYILGLKENLENTK